MTTGVERLASVWDRTRRLPSPAPAALLVWALVIAVAYAWGTALGADRYIGLEAPPLYGTFDVRIRAEALIAVGTGGALVWLAPLVARRLGWRALLWASALGAAAWAVALAVAAGTGELAAPLDSPASYLHDVPLVHTAQDFLTRFTARMDGYAVHVRSHPPGMVLLLAGLAAIGLGGAWPAAVLVIGTGAAAVPAVLLATREVAGERAARAAAPYLVLAPAALWIATTGDALFAGVGAWGVALVVLATGRRGVRADALALAGGLVLGLSLFLTYGVALLGAVVVAVASWRRRWRTLVLAGAGAAVVVAAFAGAGFWWLDGLHATRSEYAESIARNRPYDYFLIANVAALGLAIGPAGAAGLARLRRAPPGLVALAAGALAAVVLADLTGLSKAEVERIWLPFMPWLLVATAALPRAPRAMRGLLAAQAVLALALQLGVRMPW